MRKFEIVEIENSYLNFFTPAVIIATGYFLYNLFIYPLLILQWLSYEDNPNFSIDFFDLWNLIIPNVSTLLAVLFVIYILIPKLNILDASIRRIRKRSFVITFLIFSIIVTLRIFLTIFFEEVLEADIILDPPWYLRTYDQLTVIIFMFLFLVYQLILRPLLSEFIFRRTAIPLLEDRGLSPSHAVLLTSIGYCLLLLPMFFENTNLLSNIYWTISTFLFGLGTGIVYILTRNVLLSILYASFYHCYRLIDTLGFYFQNDLVLISTIIDILIILAFLVAIIIIFWDQFNEQISTNWISILKKKSVPNIRNGIIGFFIFSALFVGIQYILTETIDRMTINPLTGQQNYPDIFFLYTLFYLIIFSVPFWFTLKSEYTQY
ncbi:MAG: type II CAAX prenyl endopeptidase Rce1 family protein [Candidatus Hodarchaeota archaeon]